MTDERISTGDAIIEVCDHCGERFRFLVPWGDVIEGIVVEGDTHYMRSRPRTSLVRGQLVKDA